MDDNQKDLLLTAVAIGVQNTEACSEYWPQQKELLALLTPKRRDMVNSFYKNGYFVPKGKAWDDYVREMADIFDVDFEGDLAELYDPDQSGPLRDKIREAGNVELIDAAFKYVDGFEG